jgi:hypothetical protein
VSSVGKPSKHQDFPRNYRTFGPQKPQPSIHTPSPIFGVDPFPADFKIILSDTIEKRAFRNWRPHGDSNLFRPDNRKASLSVL